VRDLTAVLDHAGARRALLVGHSMGAHVAARLSAEHPERAAGVVLVDGGLPIPAPAGMMGGEPEGRSDGRPHGETVQVG
jgi:pimeloyl-ACP methyl ester carboxylesterase